MTEQPAPVRPGRRRSEQSRTAILRAALELIDEVGYVGLTVEGIAARSGAGKQTVYRWWPTKADVLLDALATKADLHIPIPDEGGFGADLRAFLTATFALAQHRAIAAGLRALVAQAQLDPDFGRRFRDAFMLRRREALGVLVERARARGELPASLSPGTAVDLVFGVLWYRLLATGEPLDDRLVDELVATLANARRPGPA
jgi:AcrR family transcriptional regulator